ncbi:hypothetical protein AB1399_12465 [Hydrogenibacillus schlegelii]|nr:hypothetical protein [Hydrogenibacillus schlegelii]
MPVGMLGLLAYLVFLVAGLAGLAVLFVRRAPCLGGTCPTLPSREKKASAPEAESIPASMPAALPERPPGSASLQATVGRGDRDDPLRRKSPAHSAALRAGCDRSVAGKEGRP